MKNTKDKPQRLRGDLRLIENVNNFFKRLSAFGFIALAAYLPINNINVNISHDIYEKENNRAYQISQLIDYKLLEHIQQEKGFGTLKSPKFQIEEPIPAKEPIETFFTTDLKGIEEENETLEEKIEFLNKTKTQVKKDYNKLEQISNQLNNKDINENQKEAIFNEIFKLNQTYENLSSKITDLKTKTNFSDILSGFSDIASYFESNYNSSNTDDENYVKKYGSPIDFTKKIITQIIGTDKIFDYISIYPMLKENKYELGYEDFLNDAVFYDSKIDYIKKVLVISHEIGHAIAQQSEQSYAKLFGRETNRTTIMEEASAYAFENAVPYYIKDKSMREKMLQYLKTYNRDFILNFFKDKKTIDYQDPHELGVSIAIAATTYFEDPKQAFNYISRRTLDEVSPKIMDIIYNAKEEYRKQGILKERINQTAEKVSDSIDYIIKKTKKISEERAKAIENKYSF